MEHSLRITASESRLESTGVPCQRERAGGGGMRLLFLSSLQPLRLTLTVSASVSGSSRVGPLRLSRALNAAFGVRMWNQLIGQIDRKSHYGARG